MKRRNRGALILGILLLGDAVYAYYNYYQYMQEFTEFTALALSVSSYYRTALSCFILSSATCFYSYWQKKTAPLVFAIALIACAFINEPPIDLDYTDYIIIGVFMLAALIDGISIDRGARKAKNNQEPYAYEKLIKKRDKNAPEI